VLMAITPIPKPPKKEKASRRSGVRKSDSTEYLILSDEEWDAQREIVGERAGFLCENPKCRRVAPLHDVEIEREEGVMPYLIRAGQGAHIIPRRAGGGTRTDDASNLGWLCWICHGLETDGKIVLDWPKIVAAR